MRGAMLGSGLVLTLVLSLGCGDRVVSGPPPDGGGRDRVADGRPADGGRDWAADGRPTDGGRDWAADGARSKPDRWAPTLDHFAPFPVDATPIPPGCKIHVQGTPTSCKSQDIWTQYAKQSCATMGLPKLANITLLEPCGIGVYRYVEAICCPAS